MDFKGLISQIHTTNDFFKSKVSRSIDRHLTIRNCVIGFYIIEYEQGGRDRADYGTKLLSTIASNLSLKGLTAPELSRCRQLYNTYPQILGTLSQELIESNSFINLGTASQKSQKEGSSTKIKNIQLDIEKLLSNLSFSHFVELIKINDPLKRIYYEMESFKRCMVCT